MTLESGPARGDRIFWGFFFAMCVAVSLWFVYDGSSGWPKKNRKHATDQLRDLIGPEAAAKVELRDAPTREDFEALANGKPTWIKDVTEALGESSFQKTQQRETIYYWATEYGLGVVPTAGGRITRQRMEWKTWYKSRSELQQQYMWAAVAGLVGLFALRKLILASTLRVKMDDEGMQYNRQRIPYEAMTALANFSPKGWVDVLYTENGREQKLRLDNQKVARYREIIELICQKKGFSNPVERHAKAQQAES